MLRSARNRSPSELNQDTYNREQGEVAARFADALRDAEVDSIDSLLEKRPDLDKIGRLYIAAKILTAENSHRDSRPEGADWLNYLFGLLDWGGTLDTFTSNPVTFVTYNYDRRIEDRISRGLQSKYRATQEQLVEYWRRTPVIHLHGSVGTLEKGENHVPFGARHRNRAGTITEAVNEFIDRAAEQIRVVHQANGRAPEFVRAREALGNAGRIIFLGFSFGRVNVDRLGLDRINPSASVICSRFRMTDAERDVLIREPFRKYGLSTPIDPGDDSDCLKVLRNHLDKFVSRY
jgi:hypothetical protein